MADKDRRGDDEADKTEAVEGSGKKDAGSAKKKEAKGSSGKADSSAKTDKKAEPTKKAGEEQGGHGRGPMRFVREVIEQLRKVIRPSRKELLTYTAVVLVFVSVMIALISGLDFGFTKLILLTFGNSDTGQ